MRAGTWSAFERKFDPINAPDGTPLHELAQVCNEDVHHVWTVLDCDGKLYCAAGFHYVNRFAFLLCRKPWTSADEMREYVY